MPNPLRRRANPHLLEIPVRPWLNRLSRKLGRPARLDELPDDDFAGLRALGFDAIWLMGVWRTGPLARRLALSIPELRRAYEDLVGDWDTADVEGSPYAIEAYEPPARSGGREALRTLRAKLHRHGLALVLDFMPNHVGIDHAWLNEHPEYLVAGTARDLARDPPQWFVHQGGFADRVFAHGRDPYFSGWTDTAQIDYRRAAARAAMTRTLVDVAGMADGLRCDVAMLALPDVFARTWGEAPGETAGDFWAEAIPEVRRTHPDLVLIAEVYWGLGPRLLSAGFDWVYDKELRDALLAGDVAAIRRERTGAEAAGRVLFLENHDEDRARSAFGPRAGAAAVAAYARPGLRFFFEGQIDGAIRRAPVQIARRPDETPDEETRRMYTTLLRFLDDEILHAGLWTPADFHGPGGGPEPAALAGVWVAEGRARAFVVNLEERPIQGTLRWPVSAAAPAMLKSTDGADFPCHSKGDGQTDVPMDLPSYGWRLLSTPD